MIESLYRLAIVFGCELVFGVASFVVAMIAGAGEVAAFCNWIIRSILLRQAVDNNSIICSIMSILSMHAVCRALQEDGDSKRLGSQAM